MMDAEADILRAALAATEIRGKSICATTMIPAELCRYGIEVENR